MKQRRPVSFPVLVFVVDSVEDEFLVVLRYINRTGFLVATLGMVVVVLLLLKFTAIFFENE